MKKITTADLDGFEARYRAKFVNSLSGYKSANLIGTINSQGQTNLTIISSVFHLGADPALLGFIIRPDVSPRHTLDNLRSNKYCTLNHVNSKIYKKAHQTSARYPRDVSEFSACELTEEYLDTAFKIPFVKESKLKMLVKMMREVPIEENGTHLIIGAIENVFLDESCVADDGHIKLDEIDTVCVSGLDSYHIADPLERLAYAKP